MIEEDSTHSVSTRDRTYHSDDVRARVTRRVQHALRVVRRHVHVVHFQHRVVQTQLVEGGASGRHVTHHHAGAVIASGAKVEAELLAGTLLKHDARKDDETQALEQPT